ncbi:FAST kinase domain-containing protein 1, mitochondrial [Macrobrachium rosenbergii]|uniref:FAST kinase domain-containing protein 1, mitochondrial n=1 Tax=Macrobrachium rosenbergii TaxID=79674 RepID=UPI0034D56627
MKLYNCNVTVTFIYNQSQRSSQLKMMQNFGRIPRSSGFRVSARRFSQLGHYLRTKGLQELQSTPSHYQLSRSLHSVFQVKCNLCGKVSSVLKARTYVCQTGEIGSEDEGMMSDGEIDFEEGLLLDKGQLELVRTNLHLNSSDRVVKSLAEAASLHEVFSIVENQNEHITATQICQAVVTLWDLQKVYGRFGCDFPNFKSVKYSDFLNGIVQHPAFIRLLSRLETIADDLENDAVSCLLLYLFRLGIDDSSAVMQKLLLLCTRNIDDFGLRALSRLSVYLRNQGIRGYYLQSKIVSLAERKLKTVSTPEDLKLITICLNSTSRLLSESLFGEYETLLQKFVIEGKLDKSEPRLLLKFLRFLTQKEWVKKPDSLQRQVMLHLSSKIHTMNGVEIVALSNYFQNIIEPRAVLYKIRERVRNLMSLSQPFHKKARLMLCMAPFTTYEDRSSFEEIIVENLEEDDLFDMIPAIFKCLRSMKTSNFKLCNAFWQKALVAVEREVTKIEGQFLGMEEIIRRRVYQRYMYFNNNLGGTYRHNALEKTMKDLFVEDLRGQCGLIPHKVARMSSFLIGYCGVNGIPEDILDKILSNSQQFSLLDIINLSRGIQISLAFHHKNVRRSYTEQITSLCHVLNSCTERHLKKVESLGLICDLTRAFLNRGGSSRTFLFDALVDAHIPLLGELNSRVIRDISSNFQRTKYSSPKIFEAVSEYVIENQDYMLAVTVERYLTCIYSLGYHPESYDRFFSACVHILNQDRSSLSGLSILEMSLALCMYGYVNTEILQSIFNISFLDKLDEEISACYSKGTYPYRVRHTLMELNRAVCIDHPEEKIPWFHEKYCREFLETVAVPNSVFHSEVHQALFQLVGGPEVVRANAKTPYFYLLDFEFLLDAEKLPVPVSEYHSVSKTTGSAKTRRIESNPGYRRIAVLLRNEGCYCVNSRQLMGRHQMECRHLEIMGYEVVEIPHFMWYSMAHATVEDRLQYLRTLIYP